MKLIIKLLYMGVIIKIREVNPDTNIYVGYSIKEDSYESGMESAKMALEKIKTPIIAFLYTSIE